MHSPAGERGGGELTDVVRQPEPEASDRQRPEDGAEWLSEAELHVRGLLLEVEGQDDGHRHDGHVDGETKVGQEGWRPSQSVSRSVPLPS